MLESSVNAYQRSFPACFVGAEGSRLRDAAGNSYLDFFCMAGTLNYGHDDSAMRAALLRHIAGGGLSTCLDLETPQRRAFMQILSEVVLQPRGFGDFRVQFTAPSGSDAVEAAVRLARKATGRGRVLAFHGSYHGMTATARALSATVRQTDRVDADVAFADFGGPIDDACIVGADGRAPAAVIVESTQAEGGVNVARDEWLIELAAFARRRGALLIVDDVQVGVGRSGPFFSFESSGIVPDMIVLSKSISGYGLPMALVLLRPDVDVWEPAEHTGTFRGNNLAFATATAALHRYWRDDEISVRTRTAAATLRARLDQLISTASPGTLAVRGKGAIWGIEFSRASAAAMAQRACFERGLVVERCGADDRVLKLMPPLTIAADDLERGLDIVATNALRAVGAVAAQNIQA